MPALEIRGLVAGYGGLPVLTDIDLSLAEGEICGLIGSNGAGKSTLLRAILDLGVRSEGAISILGRSGRGMSAMERARLVSYLPQDFNPLSRLTVGETVLLGRHPYRSSWSTDSDRDLKVASEVMRECDIWDLRDRVFTNLSGGEKRLVMLAAALAQEPALLLLDEPGSSLDFRHQLNMWLLLKQLSARGIGILVSTHEVGMAGRFLDRILVLDQGRKAAFGTPSETLTAEILTHAFGVQLTVSRDPATGSWIIVPVAEQ